MDDCFNAIHHWFTQNGLALSFNPDKSEAIVVGTRARQEGTISSVSLGGTSIPVFDSVRSLGVILDSTMSFDRHVENVCKTTPGHFNDSGSSSRLLTQRTLQLLVLDPDLTIAMLYSTACPGPT